MTESTDDAPNEIVAAAREAKARAAGARRRWPVALGLGIGSAALVAALLYARRERDD